jgi:hypothetical protein
LDQEPRSVYRFSEVRRLGGPRLVIRSHEVLRTKARLWTRGRTTRRGPRDLTSGNVSPREGIQRSVDFSHRGDSRDKST